MYTNQNDNKKFKFLYSKKNKESDWTHRLNIISQSQQIRKKRGVKLNI